MASLESYFDETVEQESQAIADLQVAYDRENKSLLWALDAIEQLTSTFLDRAAFSREQTAVDAKLRANALILVDKRKEPSVPQQLESLAEPLGAIFDLVEAANAKTS